MEKIIKVEVVTIEGNTIKDVGHLEFFVDGKIIVNDEIPVKELWINNKQVYCCEVIP